MASSGNFCTWSPLLGIKDDGDFGITLSNGNCEATHSHNGISTLGTLSVKSGKWYWEVHYSASSDFSDGHLICGWQSLKKNVDFAYIRQQPGGGAGAPDRYTWGSHLMNYKGAGTAVYQGGYLSSYNDVNNDTYNGAYNLGLRVGTAGKILQYAGDFDNNKLYFGIDNTWYSLANAGTGASAANTDSGTFNATYGWSIESTWQGHHWIPAIWFSGASSGSVGIGNWGQDSSFAGTKSTGTAAAADGNGHGDFFYAPPSGYLALCTANLPISSDIDPAETDDNISSKNHNTIVYTGTASTQSITGLGFKPDLVWIQNYSSQNQTPRLIDSTRGVTKSLQPSYSTAEGTESGLTAFGTDGFTIGSTQGGYNTSTATYVAWCWRANGGTTSTNTSGTITSTVQANTAGGFSIVSYTGTGTNATVGHGLSAAPEYMIIKNTGSTDNWINYNKVGGAANRGQINTGSYGTSTTSFQSTDPSATVITLGTSSGVNASTGNYIAYVWHGVEGYSKFGLYEGNGNSDGPFVYTGFRPKLVSLIRSTGGIYDVYDSARYTANPIDAYMQWSTDSAETTGYPIDFLANGFKIRTSGTGINKSQTAFYYAVWGDVPFKYNNTLP